MAKWATYAELVYERAPCDPFCTLGDQCALHQVEANRTRDERLNGATCRLRSHRAWQRASAVRQPVDLGEHLLYVWTYLWPQLIAPALLGVPGAEIQLLGMLQDGAVLRRDLGKGPVGGGVLQPDFADGERGPDASEGQHGVAGVAV